MSAYEVSSHSGDEMRLSVNWVLFGYTVGMAALGILCVTLGVVFDEVFIESGAPNALTIVGWTVLTVYGLGWAWAAGRGTWPFSRRAMSYIARIGILSLLALAVAWGLMALLLMAAFRDG